MDESRPRVHLSTLLVMLLIAGVWMVANTIEYSASVTVREPVYGPESMRLDDIVTTQQLTQRGFPFPLYAGRPVRPNWTDPTVIYLSFDPSGLAFNIVSAILVMGVVAVWMESRVKRKSVVQGAKASEPD